MNITNGTLRNFEGQDKNTAKWAEGRRGNNRSKNKYLYNKITFCSLGIDQGKKLYLRTEI